MHSRRLCRYNSIKEDTNVTQTEIKGEQDLSRPINIYPTKGCMKVSAKGLS